MVKLLGFYNREKATNAMKISFISFGVMEKSEKTIAKQLSLLILLSLLLLSLLLLKIWRGKEKN